MKPADDWVRLREAAVRKPVAEAAFVLTAVQIDNRVTETIDGFELWVRAASAADAEAELADYREEQASQKPPAPPPKPLDSGALGILGYLLVIWSVPFLQGQAPFGRDMLNLGRMQAGLVQMGEWWRTFTALTLHADSGHILSNSVFGALFGIYIARGLGSGVSWLLVLLAGAGGNAINAWLQNDTFSSIGASTATFGALGLFAGLTWGRGEMTGGMGWRRSVAPLFAGFALVVWTGTGGENTDVAAHFTGFGCGVLLGIIASVVPRARLTLPVQLSCAVIAVALVLLAWSAALTSA
jgi:membrane associated rhomboid family serine protease